MTFKRLSNDEWVADALRELHREREDHDFYTIRAAEAELRTLQCGEEALEAADVAAAERGEGWTRWDVIREELAASGEWKADDPFAGLDDDQRGAAPVNALALATGGAR